MWTGIRIVREWSAIARVIAWRIHHVAYVENLKPRRYWNRSTAFHEPDVALLNQVEQGQVAAEIALRHRHDQAQVRLHQLALGLAPYGRSGRSARREDRAAGGSGALLEETELSRRPGLWAPDGSRDRAR
jgi:hypothetical protein